MVHKAIDALAGLLLLLLVVWRHQVGKAGIPLAAAGQPTPRRGWVKRIWATSDDGGRPQWLTLTAPVLAGVLFSQMLNLGGCNTTPTQNRIANLEKGLGDVQEFDKTLDVVFVPRKEIENNKHTVENLQAQRDDRIRRLEDTTSQITLFLMQEKH